MASTTNYSWTTPDDTDLVKDGAAAIRTLGSAADTTVKNLNPGTTAGDIDYYTSSTAKSRIGIGTAGQVLQVNSGATAPEWATLSVAPSFVGCSLYQTSDQSVNTGVYTALNFAGESFDTHNFHDTSTNNTRITIPSGKGGKYLCIVAVQFGGTGSNDTAVKIDLNGSSTARIMYLKSPSGDLYVSFSAILSLVAADYVEVLVNPGQNTSTYSTASRTNFAVQYLGA